MVSASELSHDIDKLQGVISTGQRKLLRAGLQGEGQMTQPSLQLNSDRLLAFSSSLILLFFLLDQPWIHLIFSEITS